MPFPALVLLLAALPPQEKPAPAPQETALPEVKVKAKRTKALPSDNRTYQAVITQTALKVDAPLRDVPQSVGVVTEAVLQDQGASSLQDALRNVSGVAFSNGDGQRDQVTIRGFSAIGDQFVDGLRDDALYFRDLSNLERVEVLKGPAGVLFGRGSSGGVINRVTKKADGERTGTVELRAGSFEQKRVGLDLGDRFSDALAWRVTGAVEDSGGFRDQAFLKREAFTPNLGFTIGDTRLHLQVDHLRDQRPNDFGIPSYQGRPVDVDRSTYYGSAEARKDDTTTSTMDAGTLTADHRFGTWTLRNALRTYDFTLDRHNTQPGTVLEATRQVRLNHGDVLRKDRGWFDQLELSGRLATGLVGHQLLFGLEAGQQRKRGVFTTFTNVATVDLFDPHPGPLSLTAPSTTDTFTVQDTGAAYVQDLLSFGSQWKALLGLRYDAFRQHTEQRIPALADLDRTDRAVSPRAGLVFQPTPTQSWYASWSRSFQPSGELFQLAANNAAIDPEWTRNLELGLKQELWEGRASFTAALFDLERTGIKSTDPNTPALLIPVGVQRTRGLELGLAGDLAPGWELQVAYAYLDGRITKSTPGTKVGGVPVEGHRPSLTPQHSGSAWLTHRFHERWRVSLGVQASAARFASSSNLVTLPGYAVFDGAVGYRAPRWEVSLNLRNLTDRAYIASSHGSSDILLTPGGPRSLDATFRFRF